MTPLQEFLVKMLFVAIGLLGSVLAIRQVYVTFRNADAEAPELTSIEALADVEQREAADWPEELNLELPFYPQAPHANWDYPWQEACEEASVLLVANVYQDLQLNVDEFDAELLRLVEWEMETFGAYEHTDVAQTVQMIEENYGLETVVHENPEFEDIQAILNRGHLIVAPFAGKLLDNPHFRNGGPVYHMLVIKGYDATDERIVTHDVGTRFGEDFLYDWSVLQNALHDWHDDDILLGDAKIIEVLN